MIYFLFLVPDLLKNLTSAWCILPCVFFAIVQYYHIFILPVIKDKNFSSESKTAERTSAVNKTCFRTLNTQGRMHIYSKKWIWYSFSCCLGAYNGVQNLGKLYMSFVCIHILFYMYTYTHITYIHTYIHTVCNYSLFRKIFHMLSEALYAVIMSFPSLKHRLFGKMV